MLHTKILLLFRCILHEMSRNNNIKSPLQRPIFLAGDTIYVSQKSVLQPFYKENVVALSSCINRRTTTISNCHSNVRLILLRKKKHQSAILYGKCLWKMLHFRRILNKISYISYNANVSYICHKHTCAFKISSQPVSHSVSFAVMLNFRRILNEI